MLAIRLDAAHAGSQMNDDGRVCVRDGPRDLFRLSKVVIPGSGHEDFAAAPLAQFFHDARAKEAGSSGHHDARVRPETHRAIAAAATAIVPANSRYSVRKRSVTGSHP